jgi:hypothetical protein
MLTPPASPLLRAIAYTAAQALRVTESQHMLTAYSINRCHSATAYPLKFNSCLVVSIKSSFGDAVKISSGRRTQSGNSWARRRRHQWVNKRIHRSPGAIMYKHYAALRPSGTCAPALTPAAPHYQSNDATGQATREHTGEERVVRRAHGTAAREGHHLAHLRLDRLGSVAARKSVRKTSFWQLPRCQKGPHSHTEEIEARSRRTTPAVRDTLERNLPWKAARAVAVVEQAARRLVQSLHKCLFRCFHKPLTNPNWCWRDEEEEMIPSNHAWLAAKAVQEV